MQRVAATAPEDGLDDEPSFSHSERKWMAYALLSDEQRRGAGFGGARSYREFYDEVAAGFRKLEAWAHSEAVDAQSLTPSLYVLCKVDSSDVLARLRSQSRSAGELLQLDIEARRRMLTVGELEAMGELLDHKLKVVLRWGRRVRPLVLTWRAARRRLRNGRVHLYNLRRPPGMPPRITVDEVMRIAARNDPPQPRS